MAESPKDQTNPSPPAPFRCTYRLQVRNGVGFAEARGLAPHLDRLGASHLYLAPPFTARSGSTHGYDVADANELDPGLGGLDGFEAMAEALRARGLGLILDIVPNHMGVGPDNPWWWDLLQHGRSSRYAGFFDVDFDRDPDGKLVLPVLGAPLEEALGKGELTVRRDEARGSVLAYYDTPFPLAPGSADGLDPARADEAAMRRLLDAQAYRLAFWRHGAEKRNYRRFFNIDELAGLRIELPEVFEATHALVLDLARRGLVQGLRIDHVDGLADPKGYLVRLQERLREVTGRDEPFYVVVEKILSGEERLPRDWPVAGTTGYEFANQVLGLLVDSGGVAALERLRAELTGEPEPFEEVVDRSKRLVLERLFPGELGVLAEKAAGLTGLPAEALKAAIAEVLVAFPVYRTYRRAGEPLGEADRAVLGRAFAAAGERLSGEAAAALARVRALVEAEGLEGDEARQGWVTGFQQLSGPVMAKALEDTAFYRYPRLLALNEVGGEADARGLSPDGFHALNAERLRDWPHAMLGTATHDTKRGEDARARLAVLSELPDEWAAAARRWRELGAPVRPEGLHPKDEYALHQTLVGVWPHGLGPGDGAALAALRERVRGYLTKALREAKERSDWADPDQGYEERALGFADALLDPTRSRGFLEDLARFVGRIAPAGAANGLAQLLLKLTAPGVPDVYQGTELWDLSMVDPDNRRPVDWGALADLPARPLAGGDPLADWRGGAPKARVMAAALAFRREAPDLFAKGEYLPLRVEGGPLAAHAFAFARRDGGRLAVALVGRHLARPLGAAADRPLVEPARWGDAALVLPDGVGGTLEDRLTGARHEARAGRLPLRDAFARLPVALLAGG